MISKKIIIIFAYFTILSAFLVLSMASNNAITEQVGMCNNCHGATATGHVDFSVTLTGVQTVETNSTAVITATMKNNNYPLDTVSLTLESSSYYSLASGKATINVGTLGRGTTQSESWKLRFHASSDTSAIVKVDFSGRAFATSHMQYTFQGPQYTYSKSVHIITKPEPILQVESNPLSSSTLWVGSSNTSGQLTIKNTGKIDMTNVSVIATGQILVDGKTNFTISVIPALNQQSFPITIDTSKTGKATISVIYKGDFVQESIITIYFRPNPANSFTLFLGRVFGYTAYVLLFCSVVAGAGIYHLKRYISGRKIRILHSDLANLSFTMVIIHAVVLTIPNSPWSNAYFFYELLPERIPTDIGSLGLELGRSALVLMYIAVFSGYYLAKLIKRYGKRVGISIHMLSYVALILGFLHTIILGGWARAYPVIGIILFISVISVGFLKWDAHRMLNRKKINRAKRKLDKQIKPVSEAPTVEQ